MLLTNRAFQDAAVREQDHSPSLLPYLTLGTAGAFLNIALLNQTPSASSGDSFPFLLVADSDPLTRLIKAEFATDAGSKIKDVFLLVQRDEYRLSANQLAPLTNADIASFWQETYRYHRQNRDGLLITLGQQIDTSGNLVSCQPLFFCSATKVFFHPPCPVCGLPLQQCSDDQLLASVGLQPFSLSLSRYLFCPSCFSTGRGTDFYERRKRGAGLPLVKDCADLIRAFGQGVRSGDGGAGLPCPGCSQHEQCLSADASVPPLIIPFSFYPFFVLLYETMSMNGLDYLALASGASLDELVSRIRNADEVGRALHIESSRQQRGTFQSFLFDGEARWFLEVLYLKLSFLGQIVVDLFPNPDTRQPDPLLYADKIWVKVKDRPGFLPYLWNYELSYIDLRRNPLGLPAHPKMPPAYSLHLLGLIWFAVLLANSRQSVTEVHLAVERSRDRALPEDPTIPASLMTEAAFSPENIFWKPAPPPMTPAWQHLWEEALGMGCSLLQASVEGASSLPRSELVRQIQQLRTRVKRELFSERTAEKRADRSPEDGTILQILSRIEADWRQSGVSDSTDGLAETVVLSSEVDRATLPGTAGRELEQVMETVILAPRQSTEQPVPAIDEEIFQETVVLSGKGLLETAQTKTPSSAKTVEALSETVILRGPPAGEHPEEALAETVIISPPGSSQTQAPGRGAIPTAESEVLEESEAKKPKPAEEEDEMSATIILTPNRDRDRH